MQWHCNTRTFLSIKHLKILSEMDFISLQFPWNQFDLTTKDLFYLIAMSISLENCWNKSVTWIWKSDYAISMETFFFEFRLFKYPKRRKIFQLNNWSNLVKLNVHFETYFWKNILNFFICFLVNFSWIFNVLKQFFVWVFLDDSYWRHCEETWKILFKFPILTKLFCVESPIFLLFFKFSGRI